MEKSSLSKQKIVFSWQDFYLTLTPQEKEEEEEEEEEEVKLAGMGSREDESNFFGLIK